MSTFDKVFNVLLGLAAGLAISVCIIGFKNGNVGDGVCNLLLGLANLGLGIYFNVRGV